MLKVLTDVLQGAELKKRDDGRVKSRPIQIQRRETLLQEGKMSPSFLECGQI